MTALDALLPTHAMFYHAAVAATTILNPSAPDAVKSSGPDLRKYVVFRHQDGREFPVIFPRAIQHSDIDLALDCAGGTLYKPISAGSYGIMKGHVFLTGVGSHTLNLPSRPQDAALIQSLLSES